MFVNAPRLNSRMRELGLDAVVATAPENVVYTSGYWAMSQWIRRGPQAYVLVPREDRGAPVIVAATSALDHIGDQDVWVDAVQRYGSFFVERDPDATLSPCDQRMEDLLEAPAAADAVAGLVKVITERGLVGGCIGVDEIGILPAYWDKLVEALPGTRFVRAADVFRYARAVKTPAEVEALRVSCNVAEKSIAAAMDTARVGMSELEMAEVFHATTIGLGGMPVLGCIGFGARSAMINVQPSAAKLAPGDIIRFDVGGRWGHYRADIARNGVVGEPSKKIATYYRAIRVGLERAHEMIRPGVKAGDVFDAVMETTRKEGLPHYRRPHVGHGIGLDGYDAPNIAAGSADVFEAGMVCCIETPYYELGFGGLQVEDTIVVTADGNSSFMITGSELKVV